MKNTQYLSAEELQGRWKIKPFDLLKFITGKKIEYETPENYFKVMSPGIKDLSNYYFSIKAVESFEKKHPEYMPQDAPYVTPQGEILPYLDKKHEYFSKELSIAIETWLAIYGTPGGLNPEKKHKKQILPWLENHYPDLSKEAKNRITTMINADNRGGAEKTSF